MAYIFRGPKVLDLGLCFQRTNDFWTLAHIFRGPNVLDLGSCFQRTKNFWALAHVFRGRKVLGLAHATVCGFFTLVLAK